MKATEISALITLLDDDDQEVVAHVSERIKSLGKSIVPTLEKVWNPDFNPIQSERLENLIHEIQFEDLLHAIEVWRETPTVDVLKGYFLISSYFFPDLNFDEIERKVKKIRQKIWIELNYNQTPLEQVQILNHVFYYHLGFSGDQNAASNADFCINHVLDTKKGNPISLGLLYISLAQSLQLPIYGVRLINYFILAFCKDPSFGERNEGQESDVLFYINPFQKGVIFSKNQIADYIKRMNTPAKSQYFSPTNSTEVIIELIDYLIFINEQNNSFDVATELKLIRKKIG